MGRIGLMRRGEIHSIDLGQPTGHERGFSPPTLVVLTDTPAGGLNAATRRRLGVVGPDQMLLVEKALRFVLDL